MGDLNQDDFEIQNVVAKKMKMTLNKKCLGDNNPTQMEIINKDVTAGSSHGLEKVAPGAVAKNVLKTLKKQQSENKEESQRMLDVLYDEDNGDSPSVSDFVGREFAAAVLAQQGRMAVSVPDDVEGREASALMMCQSQKPRPASANSNDEPQRKQIIGSYSAAMIKELFKSNK